MNLLLLERDDWVDADCVRLDGRRLQHLREVHRASPGDRLRVGELGGLQGEGELLALDEASALLRVRLEAPSPAKAPMILLLALPRPKMLKRIFQMVTTLGVEQLVLLNSYRVEKSYWSTPWLAPEAVREQLVLGLEQARDTVLPTLTLAPRFKPFVEDELPALMAGRQGWLPHPGSAMACPAAVPGPQLVAIGPEGGFIPYEVDKLKAAGLQTVSLGARILRVDTAVAATLGRVLPLCI